MDQAVHRPLDDQGSATFSKRGQARRSNCKPQTLSLNPKPYILNRPWCRDFGFIWDELRHPTKGNMFLGGALLHAGSGNCDDIALWVL